MKNEKVKRCISCGVEIKDKSPFSSAYCRHCRSDRD